MAIPAIAATQLYAVLLVADVYGGCTFVKKDPSNCVSHAGAAMWASSYCLAVYEYASETEQSANEASLLMIFSGTVVRD